ncbi:uncharacterized protein IL334_002316 [Kwoniella shivajii]|uniref:Uncharacterized protein n=1 Tax=Kwoniella shivajii TaxID=564305 RepID=A0ABZ1CUI1_9TREE|nr:hypothetical protein IL334_002316 [Kwoniella shivajii]
MAKEGSCGPTKRVAPISATAYAFSLSTPKNKKTKLSDVNTSTYNTLQTPTRVKREFTTPQPPSFHTPGPLKPSLQPLADDKTETEEEKPLQAISSIETPRRPSTVYKPLGSYSSPIVQQLKSGDPGPSTSKTLRRLNERVGQVFTPGKGPQDETDLKPRFALHETLLSEKTADDLFSKKRAALLEEDEGLGVSPRGKRISKWTSKGAPPPSVQLANIISSSNASLHLFYTSMQHLLYPAQKVNASLPRSSRSNIHSKVNKLSPFDHIEQSATIRLRISQVVQGPTQHSSMFWCEPIKWRSPSEIPDKVLILLQPLPNGCSKLGIDPYLLAMKVEDDRQKKWHVGVWAWSEVKLPVNEMSLQSEEKNGEMEVEGDQPRSAFIVTRYLIAEKPPSV